MSELLTAENIVEAFKDKATFQTEPGAKSYLSYVSDDPAFHWLEEQLAQKDAQIMSLVAALLGFRNGYECLPEDPDVFDLEPQYNLAHDTLSALPTDLLERYKRERAVIDGFETYLLKVGHFMNRCCLFIEDIATESEKRHNAAFKQLLEDDSAAWEQLKALKEMESK